VTRSPQPIISKLRPSLPCFFSELRSHLTSTWTIKQTTTCHLASFSLRNPTACDFIFNTVTSSFKLQIGSSLIPDAGNGLFAREDIPAACEIYRSVPLATGFAVTNDRTTCHNCFRDCAMGSEPVVAMQCSGCKAARYCSKVIYSMSPILIFSW
jgi:hypothetical protein